MKRSAPTSRATPKSWNTPQRNQTTSTKRTTLTFQIGAILVQPKRPLRTENTGFRYCRQCVFCPSHPLRATEVWDKTPAALPELTVTTLGVIARPLRNFQLCVLSSFFLIHTARCLFLLARLLTSRSNSARYAAASFFISSILSSISTTPL